MINGLPEKLRSLRTKYGYSQKQVADKIGVSPSIVSGYETGERTPSTEVLLSLAYLYNTSTDYLLGKQISYPEPMISVAGLTDDQISAIVKLIEAMKKPGA